jgi:hypothetical protein
MQMDAAQHLRDALDEEQDARDHDHRLELIDRDAGRAVDRHLAIAPGPAGVFPARKDQRGDAGEEEEDVQDQVDQRLTLRPPGPIEEVAPHMAVARQRIGAAHHEDACHT